MGYEKTNRVPNSQIRLVISSGVKSTGVDEQIITNKLRIRIGNEINIKVMERREEATLLYFRAVPKEDQNSDEVIVVDVGSGNIKSAYRNNANGAFPNERSSSYGIVQEIPGSSAFYKSATKNLTAMELNVSQPITRQAFSKKMEDKAILEIEKPLVTETERCPKMRNSDKAYMAGGAFWALCRIAHPEVDVNDKQVPLDMKRDIAEFKRRVTQEGLNALACPKPENPTCAADYAKLKSVFGTEGKLLAIAEVLAALDRAFGLSDERRKVVFVNDPQFDWLTSYLERELNAKPQK